MEKYVKELLQDEKGATSVLVIFMMIILVTLGAFAITSANVNLKFSNKAYNWNSSYYALDSEAEKYVMEVDQILFDSEKKAVAYIEGNGFKKNSYEGIPAELQQTIFTNWNTSGNTSINAAMQTVYMHLAKEGLENLSTIYPENLVLPLANDSFAKELKTEINFKAHEGYDNPNGNLKVELRITPLQYEFTNNGLTKMENTERNLRYKVVTWKEWQISDQTETNKELWDGGLGGGSEENENPNADMKTDIFTRPEASNTDEEISLPVEEEQDNQDDEEVIEIITGLEDIDWGD